MLELNGPFSSTVSFLRRSLNEGCEGMRCAVAIGIQSVRTNAVPMIVLWLMAAAAVGLYYGVPGGDQFFAPFAAWQRESGWLAAFLNRVLFCGLLPGPFCWRSRRYVPEGRC